MAYRMAQCKPPATFLKDEAEMGLIRQLELLLGIVLHGRVGRALKDGQLLFQQDPASASSS